MNQLSCTTCTDGLTDIFAGVTELTNCRHILVGANLCVGLTPPYARQGKHHGYVFNIVDVRKQQMRHQAVLPVKNVTCN